MLHTSLHSVTLVLYMARKAAQTSLLMRWPLRLSVISPVLVVSPVASVVRPGRVNLLSARLRSKIVELCASIVDNVTRHASLSMHAERLSAVNRVFVSSASARLLVI